MKLPNYALERSVTAWQACAAGASDIFAPAANSWAFPRPAEPGRLACRCPGHNDYEREVGSG